MPRKKRTTALALACSPMGVSGDGALVAHRLVGDDGGVAGGHGQQQVAIAHPREGGPLLAGRRRPGPTGDLPSRASAPTCSVRPLAAAMMTMPAITTQTPAKPRANRILRLRYTVARRRLRLRTSSWRCILRCVCPFLHRRTYQVSALRGPERPGARHMRQVRVSAESRLVICGRRRVARRRRPATRRAQVRITIPRWVQLVLIPVAIFLALYFSRAASHAVFVFLISTIVALLLNPVVLAMGRIKFPRWLAVPVVYLTFVAVVVLHLRLPGAAAHPPVPAALRGHPRLARLAERAPGRSGGLAAVPQHRHEPADQHRRHRRLAPEPRHRVHRDPGQRRAGAWWGRSSTSSSPSS